MINKKWLVLFLCYTASLHITTDMHAHSLRTEQPSDYRLPGCWNAKEQNFIQNINQSIAHIVTYMRNKIGHKTTQITTKTSWWNPKLNTNLPSINPSIQTKFSSDNNTLHMINHLLYLLQPEERKNMALLASLAKASNIFFKNIAVECTQYEDTYFEQIQKRNNIRFFKNKNACVQSMSYLNRIQLLQAYPYQLYTDFEWYGFVRMLPLIAAITAGTTLISSCIGAYKHRNNISKHNIYAKLKSYLYAGIATGLSISTIIALYTIMSEYTALQNASATILAPHTQEMTALDITIKQIPVI